MTRFLALRGDLLKMMEKVDSLCNDVLFSLAARLLVSDNGPANPDGQNLDDR